jgi:hypothetical protein
MKKIQDSQPDQYISDLEKEMKYLAEKNRNRPYDTSRIGQSLVITGVRLNNNHKTALTKGDGKGGE